MNPFKALSGYWFRISCLILGIITLFGVAAYLNKNGETKAVLKEEVRELKNDLIIIDEVSKITDEITVITVDRRDDIRERFDAVREVREQKEAEVKVKTAPDDPERERQISEIRMNSLWIAFCIVEPTDKECVERYPEALK